MRPLNALQNPLALAALALLLTGVAGCTLFKPTEGAVGALQPKELQAFAAAVRISPGDAAAHYRLGIYMQERRKHWPAIEEFKAALAIDPAHVMARNAMGVSHDALGEHAQAVDAYRSALRIDPKLDYVHNNLGYCYLLQGRVDQAIEHFTEALALNGANPRYHNNLGLALARGGRFDEALAAFQQTGDTARAHRNLARLHYRAGRYKEAEAQLALAALHSGDPAITRERKAAATLSAILNAAPQQSATPPAQHPSLRAKIPGSATALTPQQNTVTAPGEAALNYRAASATLFERERVAWLSETQAAELARLERRGATVRPDARVNIEVANGNGVRRMARHVGDFLRDEHIILMYLSNASHFKHPESKIYYAPGHLQDAYFIARQLPGRQRLEEVTAIRNGYAQISVLIGRDLVAHVNAFKKS